MKPPASADRTGAPRRPAWRALLVVAVVVLPIAAACNAITGTGKYDLVDCVGDACDGGTRADAPGTGDGGGGDSSTTNPACTGGGVAIPACSEGALGRSIHTAPEDPRLITVPSGDQEAPYDPNCMMIRAGQTVTWRGNLGRHPLIQREDSTLPNPIPTFASGTEGAVTFPCPGDYNFSCRNHKDSMLGTIRVLP
ncbi:hypothetical protein BH11MYX4_BH11MYX4_51680 [soil metagenome]